MPVARVGADSQGHDKHNPPIRPDLKASLISFIATPEIRAAMEQGQLNWFANFI
jgi:hypothetical protein